MVYNIPYQLVRVHGGPARRCRGGRTLDDLRKEFFSPFSGPSWERQIWDRRWASDQTPGFLLRLASMASEIRIVRVPTVWQRR